MPKGKVMEVAEELSYAIFLSAVTMKSKKYL